MEDVYPTAISKLALTLESASEAKNIEVATHGIGEELHINLIGWLNHQIVSCVQVKNRNLTRDERVHTLTLGANVLRSVFWADEFTLLMEGFCVLDDTLDVQGDGLAHAFAMGDPNVRECLVSVHVDLDFAQIGLAPYTYELGCKVKYLEPIIREPMPPRSAVYPRALHQVIVEATPQSVPEDTDAYYSEIIRGLDHYGLILSWAKDAL